MSNSKSTRSSSAKNEVKSSGQVNNIEVLKKTFYIEDSLLKDSNDLKLERFYHPGKGSRTLFITKENEKQIMEVIEFAEPRRSWLINTDVCSNGRIYLTTPIDSTFLALHHLRKHCSQKALALDSIHVDNDSSVHRLLTKFIDEDNLKCIAEKKESGGMVFFKYNHEYTMAWLAIKTRRTAEALKRIGVHCGHNSISTNYVKADKFSEEPVKEMDFLRMACDIVGSYLDYDLYEGLIKYLEIPSELEEEKSAVQKRKSLQALNAKDNKKIKMDASNVTEKLQNSDLLDDSVEESKSPPLPSPQAKATPLKEKVLTAKEKALAKGAKGTKNIASFFQKK